MLKVSVTKLHPNKKINTNWVKQVVKETLSHEGILDGEVSVVLGDDELLKRLNNEYRGIDSPTDILAFGWGQTLNVECSPTFHIQGLTPILGEVIISIDAALRQAEEYKHSFEKELTILLIHGVLHILGYDHSQDNLPQEPMAIRTMEILTLITGNWRAT
ncbi:MAG: rRNA maturation RNase YbeY [bacterium]